VPEGIVDQVGEHLRQPVAIAGNARQRPRHVDRQPDALLARLDRQALGYHAQHIAQLDGMAQHVKLTGLDACDVEQALDHAVQAARLVVDHQGGMLGRLGIGGNALGDGLRKALDAGQRRAQIVRDVRHEIALGLLRGGDARGHLVERFGQRADLLRAADRHPLVEVALGDALRRHAHLLERARH